MIIRLLILAASLASCSAFHTPASSVDRVIRLQATRQNHDGNVADDAKAAALDAPQLRRDFLRMSAAFVSSATLFPSKANAGEEFLYKRDESGADLTSQLFNPDGSLKDPNAVIVAQEKEVVIPFSIPASPDSVIVNLSTDGSSPPASDSATNIKATYKVPTKWNQEATSSLPLYYDSSEGKNGQSCDRITIYSVSAPKNIDMSTLEKASKVGVDKSLFMSDISNGYFDQGVLKADLIGGRTSRKPIKSSTVPEGIDEQVYYEFDLAFAPLSCPDYMEGNKENLGLGFCPYDNILLVSATVLNNADSNEGGTLVVCVVECNKNEWKIGNTDLKRVRNSFVVDRA
mmetsp:Transcript_22053/g.36304  ORF Transcript_22053/g.36304 Transcript_22053/m.36304 type:complete len:344 (+) Transcript_22053:37-1068(+)